MQLDATVGGSASNVYATLEETDAYFASHINYALWNDFTKNQKERAKITAVQMIDREKFRLYKASIAPFNSDDYQARQFPRSYCYDDDGELYIPSEVKNAEAEQSFFLLTTVPENQNQLCAPALDFLSFHLERMVMLSRM